MGSPSSRHSGCLSLYLAVLKSMHAHQTPGIARVQPHLASQRHQVGGGGASLVEDTPAILAVCQRAVGVGIDGIDFGFEGVGRVCGGGEGAGRGGGGARANCIFGKDGEGVLLLSPVRAEGPRKLDLQNRGGRELLMCDGSKDHAGLRRMQARLLQALGSQVQRRPNRTWPAQSSPKSVMLISGAAEVPTGIALTV